MAMGEQDFTACWPVGAPPCSLARHTPRGPGSHTQDFFGTGQAPLEPGPQEAVPFNVIHDRT
jgi:hypothetical protein